MSVFEDLNAIYDEGLESEAKEELTEEVMSEPASVETEAKPAEEALTEDSEEIPADEEIEEPRQLILACDKCGALVIKAEADIAIDEATDLVNVEETCQYCEEAAGYTISGVLAPYTTDVEEALKEGIFDKFKKKKADQEDTEASNTRNGYVVIDYRDGLGVWAYASRDIFASEKDAKEFAKKYATEFNVRDPQIKVVTVKEAETLTGQRIK